MPPRFQSGITSIILEEVRDTYKDKMIMMTVKKKAMMIMILPGLKEFENIDTIDGYLIEEQASKTKTKL
ncbi:hypothetical protein M8J77_006006 [Diaphorina citri]|nr:hypothetical protein M8J77_006006 [Diaphorina citri]